MDKSRVRFTFTGSRCWLQPTYSPSILLCLVDPTVSCRSCVVLLTHSVDFVQTKSSFSNVVKSAVHICNTLTKTFVSGNKFTCDKCGRLFSWPSSLKLHQRMSCGKPLNFCCTFCDYKSNFKGNLKRHLICKHWKHKRKSTV